MQEYLASKHALIQDFVSVILLFLKLLSAQPSVQVYKFSILLMRPSKNSCTILRTNAPLYMKECLRKACIYVFVCQMGCKVACSEAWVINSGVVEILLETTGVFQYLGKCLRDFVSP
jgi:hypothetical protein